MCVYKYHGTGIDKKKCDSETAMEKLVAAEINILTAQRWAHSFKQWA